MSGSIQVVKDPCVSQKEPCDLVTPQIRGITPYSSLWAHDVKTLDVELCRAEAVG